MRNESLHHGLALLGRCLLVAIFIPEAWAKLRGYDSAVAYMQKFGVPGVLLPLAIVVEFGASLLIIAGWQTRIAALALAGFSLATAILFHTNFADHNQELHFWKNLAMAGGFVMLYLNGAGGWSFDAVSWSSIRWLRRRPS
jgi:putative oxidoreductase